MSWSKAGVGDEIQKSYPTMTSGIWKIRYFIYKPYNIGTVWVHAFEVEANDRHWMTLKKTEVPGGDLRNCVPYVIGGHPGFERFLERVDRYENYMDLEIVCEEL